MANGEVVIALEKMEEKAEGTPVADNSKEKVASHSKPEATVENSVMKDEHGSSKKWSPKEEEAHDPPPQGCFLQKWKKIFVASCLFAVLLDPLFLYVPMMRDEIKCLLYDRNLKIAALLLRSVTDLFYILDIIFQIYASPNYSDVMDLYRRIRLYCSKLRFWRKYFVPTIAKTILGSYNILIDIMAILPLPQVAIFIFFSKMRDLRSLSTKRMAIMNFFVLLQYVPRVLCIYLSCKELKRTPKGGTGETAIWVKGVLNFFMYILASHVLGAIWYFFAIQRIAICWHDACRKENGCDTSTFGCHEHQTFRNIRFLNDLCPISPVNTTRFDFGIYGTILQSGILGSTNYFEKFSNCFWWGLRNLSSLGSNLEPSIDGWENLFAAFISIIGLLLFLYLIGNLQTYMQLNTARREDHRHKMKVERKMEKKDPETELWLSKNGVPKRLINDIKSQMMVKVRQEVEVDRDADLDYIFSILPSTLQMRIKQYMPMTRLKQVPMFQNMDESVLKEICRRLKPKKFTEGDIIIEEGKRLKKMVYIVEGLVSIRSKDSSSDLQQRGAGQVCGEKLVRRLPSTSFPRKAPETKSAITIGDVEALVLKASDVQDMVFEFGKQYFLGTKIFSAKQLEEATNNYHNIIGQGISSTVYEGNLPDGTRIAVKKSKTTRPISYSPRVIKEVGVASQIDHKNVVRFLGCCLEPQTQALVFEYIPKGTLSQHTRKEEEGRGSSSPLSWELRIKIASETAEALAYLHSFTPNKPIIHGHVNTKNILLDDDFTAKLSGFGVSRLFIDDDDDDDDEDEAVAAYVREKLRYLDPEYNQPQALRQKSDVYNFGVVLAELLTSQVFENDNERKHCGTQLDVNAGLKEWNAVSLCWMYRRNPYNMRDFSPERVMGKRDLAWFLSSLEKGHLDQILDGEIIVNEATSSETAKQVADMAKRCLRPKGDERPSMKEVAAELERLLKFMAENQRGEPSFC
ncbi:cyclic nucleotide-gated ion channel 1-like isoform X2 [Prunus dulcis]|uniref:cyclic nucleotide-gated ion channel 1-like isoform X2 n=1 Tax=Prunus dulcis TaxID=3755 RepID=UPI0014837C13|nr:cyclic nucleotide-gated ion channel 1-like isoform X2 [Prunus dulcis]